MIVLAPYSAERHGVSQAPHAILATRNGMGISNGEGVFEAPIPSPVGDLHDPAWAVSSLESYLGGFGHPDLVLGGEHSITLAVLRDLVRRYMEPVYLVMYDAHTDDYGEPGVINSGNWLRVAQDEGLLKGVVFDDGGRGSELPGSIDLQDIPPEAPVHVTVDVDVLTPWDIAMATPFPVPGGYRLDELLEDLQVTFGYLGSRPRLSADVVEYDPARDATRAGAFSAASIVNVILDYVS